MARVSVSGSGRCGLCGAPTRMQGVQGWPAQVCPSCGAVLLDARAAQQILGSDAVPRAAQSEPGWRSSTDPLMSDARIALHLENLRAERQRRLTIAIGLATSIIVLVLALPLSFVVYSTVRDQVASRREPPPALQEALPSAGLQLESLVGPAPALVVAPPPSPALVAQEVPEPEPVETTPAPAARPSSASAGDDFAALVRQGWALADKRSPAAGERFRAALLERPGDPEASYGLGYVQLQQGDTVGARKNLCAAQARADGEMRREIRSLLEHNELTCTP